MGFRDRVLGLGIWIRIIELGRQVQDYGVRVRVGVGVRLGLGLSTSIQTHNNNPYKRGCKRWFIPPSIFGYV